MKINHFLEVNSYKSMTDQKTGRAIYKASLEGVQMFDVGVTIPLIKNQKCVDLITPYELHISANLTIVFFTIVQSAAITKSALDAYTALYRINAEGVGSRSYHGGGSDMQRPRAQGEMDPAMAMMLHVNRPLKESARMEHHEGDIDSMDSLWDAMRNDDY